MVGADAGRRRAADGLEIGIEESIRERPHRQPRRADVLEDHGCVPDERNGRMKLVGASRQRAELCTSSRAVGRFAKQLGVKRQDLVGAEHHPGRVQCCDSQRLLPRQERGDGGWRFRRHPCFQASLVDVGRTDLDRYAGCLQQRSAHGAARCQHQRIGGKPQRHRS